MFWPCPDEDHPGTPRLFADRFATADGRATFIRVEYREPAEPPDADYPYVLTTGRLMAQYQSGTQTRRVPAPSQAQAQPEAQLHPDLARRLGIAAADIVELTSRRGAATFRAQDQHRHPAGRDLRAVPLGRRVGGQRADQPGARPVLEDARLQGLRGRPDRIGSPDDSHCWQRRRPHRPLRHPPTPLDAGTTPQTLPTSQQCSRQSRRKDLPMLTQNRFLQGIYPFEGAGLEKPVPISEQLSHLVPDGVISQALYFRGGNSSDQLIIVVLMRDGVPMRYFPIGAKSDVHVPLRVVEDIEGGSVVEL